MNMLYALLFLFLMALAHGISTALAFKLNLYIKNLSSPHYDFGLSYRRHIIGEGEEEIKMDLLTIGLFFFSLTFEFYKR